MDKGGDPGVGGSGIGHGRGCGRSLEGSEGREDRWQIAWILSCVGLVGIHWREVASLVLIGLLMMAKHPAPKHLAL